MSRVEGKLEKPCAFENLTVAWRGLPKLLSLLVAKILGTVLCQASEGPSFCLTPPAPLS